MVCPEGTYASNGLCIACEALCAQCSGPGECLLCLTPYVVANGSCACPPLYVMLSNGTCSLTPAIADPCYYKPYRYITNYTCTAQCGSGFYLDNSTFFCEPCQSGCASCSSSLISSCTLCATGWVFSATVLKCVCAPGYYLYNSNC